MREDSNGVWDQKGAALIVRLLKYTVSASTIVTRLGPGQPRHLITIHKEEKLTQIVFTLAAAVPTNPFPSITPIALLSMILTAHSIILMHRHIV